MKLIDKDALVAEIERWIKHYNFAAKEFGDEGYKDNVLMEQCKAAACEHILSLLETLEVKEVDNMPNIRFPHYKSIVEKVFGAGNLEFFEYEEAEKLVSLAKEELLKDLSVSVRS